jgi:hypothetical protein
MRNLARSLDKMRLPVVWAEQGKLFLGERHCDCGIMIATG